MMPVFHWKINNVSACMARETLNNKLKPRVFCQYVNKEDLLADIERLKKLYPDARIEIVEGGCTTRGSRVDLIESLKNQGAQDV
jgi:hypothetical protein